MTSSTELSVEDPAGESATSSTAEPMTTGGGSNIDDSNTSNVHGHGNGNRLNCEITGKEQRINCSSEVYSDPATWRLSRDYLEQQIRVLRIQLDELKVIRKHLRAVRPLGSNHHGEMPTEAVQSPEGRHKKNRLKSRPTESPLPTAGWPWDDDTDDDNTDDDAHQLANHGTRQEEEESTGEEASSSSSAGSPAETIQVTIYDNRKIKQVSLLFHYSP